MIRPTRKEILAALRIARGEAPVGRKIGFTNRNIWAEYGVFAPIWGEVYDGTLVDVVPGAALTISHLPQPRVEPEIVLGLDRDLDPGMPLEAIETSIAWIAGNRPASFARPFTKLLLRISSTPPALLFHNPCVSNRRRQWMGLWR